MKLRRKTENLLLGIKQFTYTKIRALIPNLVRILPRMSRLHVIGHL